MGQFSCDVCNDRVLLRVADEELAKPGANGAFVSRLLTARGYPVSALVLNGHRRHAILVPPNVARTDRDMARMVRDKAAELFEAGELDLTKRKHVPAIGLGLKAQTEINRQAARVNTTDALIAVALMFAGHGRTIPDEMLLDDGIIDGRSSEVDDSADVE